MEDEVLQSTIEDAPALAQAPERVHAEGILAVLLIALFISLLVRRVGKANLAPHLRRWVPVAFTSVWAIAIFAVAVIYARGLPGSWSLVIWLLFIVVTVASIGWLRSVLAGIAVSLEGHIKLGDSIRVGDVTGEVTGFGVRATRLRGVDGAIHEVPNERLVTDFVTNLSGEGGDSATELVFAVPKHVAVDEAVEVARRIAILSPLASPRHRPEVFLEARGNEKFEVRIRGYAFDAAFQDHFRSDVVSRIQAEFTADSPDLITKLS